MRNKILFVLSLLCFILAGIYGISKKDSYTNVTAGEEPMGIFSVAPFQDAYITIIESPETMEEAMFSVSESVMRVEPIEDTEFIFKTRRQKVLVKEVLYGKEELVGTEITLVPEAGRIFDDRTVNMGFHNLMLPGEEYLVYITERIDTLREDENVYYLPGTVVEAVFAYENRTTSTAGAAIYVPYTTVKGYEYFVHSEEGLNALLNLREYVMQKWGQL